MHHDLSVYIPHDRRRALAAGAGLPDRATGAAMLADISGFTPLAEALTRQLGPRRGAEELVHYLNQVYTALITTVAPAGGSVIGFAGDAITCWFDDRLQIAEQPNSPSAALRAAACALAMQAAMGAFGALAVPGAPAIALTLSVGIVHGPVRRFLVGDPQIQLLDTLAGTLLDRLVAAEGAAGPARCSPMTLSPPRRRAARSREWPSGAAARTICAWPLSCPPNRSPI